MYFSVMMSLSVGTAMSALPYRLRTLCSAVAAVATFPVCNDALGDDELILIVRDDRLAEGWIGRAAAGEWRYGVQIRRANCRVEAAKAAVWILAEVSGQPRIALRLHDVDELRSGDKVLTKTGGCLELL